MALLRRLWAPVARQLDQQVHAFGRTVGATQNRRCHGMTLFMIRSSSLSLRDTVMHKPELPAQVVGILHAGIESLATDGTVYVRRIPAQQHAPRAIALDLATES